MNQSRDLTLIESGLEAAVVDPHLQADNFGEQEFQLEIGVTSLHFVFSSAVSRLLSDRMVSYYLQNTMEGAWTV